MKMKTHEKVVESWTAINNYFVYMESTESLLITVMQNNRTLEQNKIIQ